MQAEVREQAPFVVFDIEANAFLFRMVRRIVGALVLVGRGEMEPDGFEEILQARDPGQIKQVAPAQGLCLMVVRYGSNMALAPVAV
jgi:tRNA pseudouridine38-40 synthase